MERSALLDYIKPPRNGLIEKKIPEKNIRHRRKLQEGETRKERRYIWKGNWCKEGKDARGRQWSIGGVQEGGREG